jgi:hypothetical protein
MAHARAPAWTLIRLALLFVVGGCATSQPSPPPLFQLSEFQILRGDSVIATEQVLTYADRIEGSIELMGRARAEYVAFLADSARIRRIETRITRQGGGTENAMSLEFASDSVSIQRTLPFPSSERHATGPVMPYLHPSPGLLEQILRRAIRTGAPTEAEPRVMKVWLVGYNRATDAKVSFVSPRIVDVELAGTPIRVWLDEFGIQLAEVPSFGWLIQRQQR